MSRKEILEKSVQKAINDGWDSFDTTEYWKVYTAYGDRLMVEFRPAHDAMGMFYGYKDVIFDHDFAKALWGGIELMQDGLNGEALAQPQHLWQYHLQQMVIADDPIQYLADNI